jgi:hypothetical protein
LSGKCDERQRSANDLRHEIYEHHYTMRRRLNLSLRNGGMAFDNDSKRFVYVRLARKSRRLASGHENKPQCEHIVAGAVVKVEATTVGRDWKIHDRAVVVASSTRSIVDTYSWRESNEEDVFDVR